MLEDRASREGLLCLTGEELRSVKRTSAITEVYSVEDTVFARGKFATVRRASHKTTGVQYAAKYIKKRRRAIDMTPEIYHEICVLLNCASSSRVVRLHEVYETNSDVVLVLEMAAGGELQRIFDSDHCLTEVEARRAMRQILEGLSYLHEKNIAHLDLKPQNLLLTVEDCCDDIKLCDFGVSRLLEPGTEVRALLGTPDYVAPEVLSYDPISLSTDIWSAGVLAYVLLSGYTPFGAETKQQTYLNISQCVLTFEPDHFGDVSSAAIDFIKSALVVNPRNRPTVQELLQHHWISPKSHILPPLTLKTTSDAITTTPKTTPLSQHSDCSPEDSDISLEKDADENVVYHLDTKYVSKMVNLFNNKCLNIIPATSIDSVVDDNRTVTVLNDSGVNIENKPDEAPGNLDADILDEHTAVNSLNNNNENKLLGHSSVNIENESRLNEAPTVIEAGVADQHMTDKEWNYNKSHEVLDNNGVASENYRIDEAPNTTDSSLVEVASVDEVLNNDLKHGNNSCEVLADISVIENITSTDEAPTNLEADNVLNTKGLHNNDATTEDKSHDEALNTIDISAVDIHTANEVLDNNGDDTEVDINRMDKAPTIIDADVVDQDTADKGLNNYNACSEDDKKSHHEELNTIAIATLDVHTVNNVLDDNDDDTEDEVKIDEVPTNIEVVRQHSADTGLNNNDTNANDTDVHAVNEILDNNGDDTEDEIKRDEVLGHNGIDNINRIDEATNIEADTLDNVLNNKDQNTNVKNKAHVMSTNGIAIEKVNKIVEAVNKIDSKVGEHIKIDEELIYV